MQKLKPFQLTVTCSTLTSVTGAESTDLLTKTAHGLVTGTPVIPTFSAGFAGLSSGTRYYAIYVSADTFKLAASRALALAGTAINFTTDGTGMTVAKPTAISTTIGNATSVLLMPQTDANSGAGNSFTAYAGGLTRSGIADPRIPIGLSNPAVNVEALYDLSELYVLAASGDGVDVFGFKAR